MRHLATHPHSFLHFSRTNFIWDRVFLAEARLILSKMVWNFDLEMVDTDDWNWMDQKAFLVFELKALMVKLKEKALA